MSLRLEHPTMAPPSPHSHPALRARVDHPRSVLGSMLTAKDVAVLLGTTQAMVYRKAIRGDIKGYRHEGRWYFKREEVAA